MPARQAGEKRQDFNLLPSKDRIRLCLKYGSPRFELGQVVWLGRNQFGRIKIDRLEIMRIQRDGIGYLYFVSSPTIQSDRGWHREKVLFATEQDALAFIRKEDSLALQP